MKQAPKQPKKLTKAERQKKAWFGSKQGQAWLAARRARADWSRLDNWA